MYLTLDKIKATFDGNPSVRCKEETVHGRRLVIVNYSIYDNSVFTKPLGKELRGHTFDAETGECVVMPFEKFFNVGENAFTLPEHFAGDLLVHHKHDGSMLTPYRVSRDIPVIFKTRRSFYSDVANAANAAACQRPDVQRLCADIMDLGYTPIFEYTDPDWRVVVDYGRQPEFYLLAARSRSTGEYMTHTMLDEYARFYGVNFSPPMVRHDNYIDTLLADTKTVEGIEGWVIENEHGTRAKIKTDWYLKRHRLLDWRERDVANAVLDGTIDDLIAASAQRDIDLSKVIDIRDAVTNTLRSLTGQVDDLAATAKEIENDKERIDFINGYCGNLSGLVWRAYRGQEFADGLVRYYRKNYLDKWPLRSVINSNFGAA